MAKAELYVVFDAKLVVKCPACGHVDTGILTHCVHNTSMSHPCSKCKERLNFRFQIVDVITAPIPVFPLCCDDPERFD